MIKTQVTKQEFYNTMNPLDVIPSPQGNYDDINGGYLTFWKLRNDKIIGESIGNNYFIIN